MWKKYDRHTAVYHTKSAIENFRFAVTLKTINSLVKIPKFDKAEGEDGGSAAQVDSTEKINIGWQEKIFSTYELQFYKDVENCITDNHKDYHRLIITKEHEENTSKIFTYVQGDNFMLDEELVRHSGNGKAHPFRNLNENKYEPEGVEMMYVFAGLSPDTLLLALRWLPSEGILIVFPDFNSFNQNPYFIEIDTDYRHLYCYAVQNISKSDDTLLSEVVLLPKVIDFDTNLSSEFDMPPKLATRVMHLFEIQEAQDFEHDNLHIRYKITLPERFKLEDGHLLGSTQSSKSSMRLWKFGHCFQLTILCDSSVKLDDRITLYFMVISIDSWGRERIEGMVSHVVILKPHCEVNELLCYRLNYGILDKIERIFIGGRRTFDLEQFNDGHEGFLNRYQTSTISTGKFRLRSQCITQRTPNTTSQSLGMARMRGMTLDDVVKGYQEAKKRLQKLVI